MSEIVVTNGHYATGGRAVFGTMTDRVAIDKAVTLRSAHGPLVTVIAGHAVPGTTNGDGAICCVYVGTNAVLSGFTLTHGHTRTAGDYYREQCGGGARCEISAVVNNCNLCGNSASAYGGANHASTLNSTTVAPRCTRLHPVAPGCSDFKAHGLRRLNAGGQTAFCSLTF